MSASGRPVSFWLRYDEIDEIDEAAAEAGVTRSEYVKDAIRHLMRLQRPASPPSPAPD